MSVEALTTVLHHSRSKGTTKLVLVGIANHAGDGGSWPTLATLARYANVNVRNVRAAIAKLVDLGEVRVEVQNGGTHDYPQHRRPNRYTVLVTCPPWCDRSTQHRDTRARHEPVEAPLDGGSLATSHEGEGGSLATGGGGSLATSKPYLEPDLQDQEPQVQDTREAPCSECGARNAYVCQRAQIQWVPEDRHAYTPAARAGQAQQETEGVG